ENRLVILGEEDLFGNVKTAKESQIKQTHDSAVDLLSMLVPGDFVVHSDYGIAEFAGTQVMTAAGNQREYLLLNYAGEDKLYVPTDQVHKVQKYLGMEGYRPSLHSLNSKVWSAQKQRVKKNVELIAKELLELYAKRQTNKGFSFFPDSELQQTMESCFPFIETPDQLKAITETKKDMESDLSMDRLICGDVGYGKTEVAIRAAFKAVCSGKQVAILVPTTILAFQHFQTFSSRLKDFPLKVEMLSRLRSNSEQKAILNRTKLGKVDVLIGTHRILSFDVHFQELGLLIVDEEHRFGVKHKERLKELRTTIDVLSMTATPIPRTLHMALSGIRQISVINTPPDSRLPVHTYVAPFDSAWAKRAILEELKRGGQVFYVFNRVERIDQRAAFLRELVPEVRIVVAHGQMAEELLENIMLAFMRHEHDILLCTTIIESGLDIPNVNTIIIEEAERLGLSQLYQLRGRVGRSTRQAWAYIFYSKGRRLTEEAHQRLQTIEEHTALGSGFKIALRDLQIRGAGNLLGMEQSGHIAAVGFSLYVELLEEAVKKAKGQFSPSPIESCIEIPISALFPRAYIPEDEARIDMYTRLARTTSVTTLEAVRMECEDRFGELPLEAKRVFQVAKLRILASNAGIIKVTRQSNRLRFECAANHGPTVENVMESRVKFFKRVSVFPSDAMGIYFSLKETDGDKVLVEAERFLEQLK
ncbi:transcription-repair coupling factor, partial [bacterium]|nr:transcription-repair coupling factor [bacterium]